MCAFETLLVLQCRASHRHELIAQPAMLLTSKSVQARAMRILTGRGPHLLRVCLTAGCCISPLAHHSACMLTAQRIACLVDIVLSCRHAYSAAGEHGIIIMLTYAAWTQCVLWCRHLFLVGMLMAQYTITGMGMALATCKLRSG